MSLLFVKFHRDFAAIYKDLKTLKRQNKFQKVFRPGRSKKEVDDRRIKYAQIDKAAHNMMSEIVAGFEAAEMQKAAFVAAGQSYVSISILEALADLGYAPHDTKSGESAFLEMREFIKIDDPRHRNNFKCNCCPIEPNFFDSEEELRLVFTESAPRHCALLIFSTNTMFVVLMKIGTHINVHTALDVSRARRTLESTTMLSILGIFPGRVRSLLTTRLRSIQLRELQMKQAHVAIVEKTSDVLCLSMNLA
jgi:hypothetical protein